tara:strand:+ start:201 stop:806 length:606 start_codon:yes stop_codon:yes gene_type:complete
MAKNPRKNFILKRNFELKKIIEDAPHLTKDIINKMINHVNESMQDNIDRGLSFEGKAMRKLKDSTIKLKGSDRKLINRGTNRTNSKAMRGTKIIRASKKKLQAEIHMTGVSGRNSIVRSENGKQYYVKRQNPKAPIGALQNAGYTTSPTSMIPNKKVPARRWFGINRSMRAGGKRFNKFLAELMMRYNMAGKFNSMKNVKE